MTEPADFSADDELLPGLEPAERGERALKRAARRSIVQLEAVGYLDERHAVLCQLMLDMADVVAKAVAQGKASAAAMAAAQLQASYQLMVPESGGGGEGDDEWSELVAELRRSATEVRDQA